MLKVINKSGELKNSFNPGWLEADISCLISSPGVRGMMTGPGKRRSY
jgi:hypothetical protein